MYKSNVFQHKTLNFEESDKNCYKENCVLIFDNRNCTLTAILPFILFKILSFLPSLISISLLSIEKKNKKKEYVKTF